MADTMQLAPLCLMRDLDAIRALFPVTQQQTYLVNAAQSPLNNRSSAALNMYLDMAAVDLDARPSVRKPIRAPLAGMFAVEHNFTTLKFHDDARRYETVRSPIRFCTVGPPGWVC